MALYSKATLTALTYSPALDVRQLDRQAAYRSVARKPTSPRPVAWLLSPTSPFVKWIVIPVEAAKPRLKTPSRLSTG
ncbi:hypothetical protein X749_14555 [Mesorhizobium sp. LNJC391B00]|nr:hypothetical protein X749_14555 [Mesorhizobium sp. LNJC391B00]